MPQSVLRLVEQDAMDKNKALEAADAKRDVEAQRTAGDDVGLDRFPLAETHDRALAEGPFDVGDGGLEGLVPVHGVLFHET